MLLARVEVLEQEVEELERRIETLEHIFLTASEPAGKKGRKKTTKKSTKWDGQQGDAIYLNHHDDFAVHSLHR